MIRNFYVTANNGHMTTDFYINNNDITYRLHYYYIIIVQIHWKWLLIHNS